MSKPLERYAGMSVLVVDDNPSNVALLEALLANEGMVRVHAETDPRRVPSILVDFKPDLVLLDLHMPHVDGHQVLRQIKEFAAGTYLPVIVLTADTTIGSRDRALGAGAQDFLTKPLDANETILRIANLLETRQLYSALRQSVNFSDGSTTTNEDLEVRQRVESALEERSINPVYQPVVDITSMATVGYEGLSRFPDADHRGPDRWFADAFDVGLGVELEWLAASLQLRVLDALDSDEFLAINLSPAAILHFGQQQLCELADCARVVIELTEHVPVEDYGAVHRALKVMQEHGTRLAVDDVGAGYAGFRHLLDLAPDIIKLDISLVHGIDHSDRQRSLALALTAFAHDVGAIVIAEGVERREELEVLRELEVGWGQGYFLGRPRPFHSPESVSMH